jgi:hypothetical protein
MRWIILLLLATATCNTNQAKSSVSPLIYIYEPPINVWHRFKNESLYGDISDSFFGLDQLLPQLLRSSPHHTKDSSLADYFFVDGWWAWPSPASSSVSIADGISIIRKLYPFWDRKNGSDHIVVASRDQGRCEPYAQSEVLSKAIVISHYGRLVKENLFFGQCDLSRFWGGACDEEMTLGEASIRKTPIDFSRRCFISGQDIVVPPTCFEPHPYKPSTLKFKTPFLNPELRSLNRSIVLEYSGGINLDPKSKKPWVDAGYSFGARQTMHRMFKNATGFSLLDHHTHENYWERKSSSIFCLAAAGWGWGGRMKNAVTRGCIPLIVQDGILVEWEEQLPLKEYAVRVPMWMVHKTPDILNAFIDTGRVAKMQRALACTWKLHWWRRAVGRPGSEQGRAFEVLMCTLKRRLLLRGSSQQMIPLDLDECSIECGDGRKIRLNKDINGV